MAVVRARFTVTTPNATPVVAWTSPTGFQGAAYIHVYGHRPFNGDKAVYWIPGSRSDIDNATIVGAQTLAEDAGAAGWSAVLSEGTNAMQLTVTGGAYSVTWVGFVDYWTVA